MSKFEQFYISNCLYYLQSLNFKTSFMFISNSMISNYITYLKGTILRVQHEHAKTFSGMRLEFVINELLKPDFIKSKEIAS